MVRLVPGEGVDWRGWRWVGRTWKGLVRDKACPRSPERSSSEPCCKADSPALEAAWGSCCRAPGSPEVPLVPTPGLGEEELDSTAGLCHTLSGTLAGMTLRLAVTLAGS